VIFNPQRLLCISPHTDDAEVSSGGTISRFLREGTQVHVLVLSSAAARIPAAPRAECRQALKILRVPEWNVELHDFPVRRLLEARQNILDLLLRVKRTVDPDLVLLPSLNDIHQDHQAVALEGLRAFKDRTILGYEYPWNHQVFNTTAFIPFTDADLATKIKAIGQYRSQRKAYMKPEIIRAWALTRGVAVKARYAESFEVLRLIL